MEKPQQDLPGIERGYPDVEEIGAEIAAIDEESWKQRERREDLVKRGIEAMKAHNLTTYEHHGVTLKLIPGVDKLKVRKKVDSDGNGE